MAPEGWKLETNAIQLDMYAMGIVFFELITLQFPYDSPTNARGFDFDLFKQMHFFQSPKQIHDYRKDIPNGINHVIQRMLAKRPQDRFGSWNEIRQALVKSWGKENQASSQSLSNLTARLLEETGRSYHEKSAKEAEAARLADIRAEELKIDDWQIKQLLQILQEAVDEFNQQSSLGQIKVQTSASNAAWKTYIYDVPFAGVIALKFYQLDPPMSLAKGHIRLFGHLVDAQGSGFNYVLFRKGPDDIYGEWQTCKIGISALVDRRKYPLVQNHLDLKQSTSFAKSFNILMALCMSTRINSNR